MRAAKWKTLLIGVSVAKSFASHRWVPRSQREVVGNEMCLVVTGGLWDCVGSLIAAVSTMGDDPCSRESRPREKKNMLNPNSYAIITGKNHWVIQTDRYLQGILQNVPGMEPFFGTLEPLKFGTLTWNPYFEPRNLLEHFLETLVKLLGTWNLGNSCILYLEHLLGTSEPSCLESSLETISLEASLGTCLVDDEDGGDDEDEDEDDNIFKNDLAMVTFSRWP